MAQDQAQDQATAAEQTHFGFRTVAAGDKAGLVHRVFDSVAGRYDLMNDLMSGGVHRLWKRSMIDWLAPRAGQQVLDVSGGTGDIAFRILQRTRGKANVTVCDASDAMLEVGRDRAIDRGILSGIEWICGDAEDLPLADASQDALTIAFGIRNVTHIDKALSEFHRVLRPGGRLLALEFSTPVLPGLDRLYDAYSFNVIPAIGERVTGDREAYDYLVESIRRFPRQQEFARLIKAAGFGQVKYRNMSGGIVALHSGWRL